jgi:hypothetical protein
LVEAVEAPVETPAPQVKAITEFTVEQLRDELKNLNIPFDEKATKKALYKVWADFQQ